MDFAQSTPRPRAAANGAAGGSDIPSSSPAFATPAHPILPPAEQRAAAARVKSTILPIRDLPPARLRPVAFRVFTKKHNLNLSSAALDELAAFVGENCGSRWRDEGLAEPVLEEVAKSWKRRGGALIVEGKTPQLRAILDDVGSMMEGGRLAGPERARGQDPGGLHEAVRSASAGLSRESSGVGGGSGAAAAEAGDGGKDEARTEPRHWLRVVGAFDQPRLAYNAERRHFERIERAPSVFADPARKTALFRDRYGLIQQRLMRNESFQAPAVAPSRATALHRTASATATQTYKLTPIANLLGRTGTAHVMLGLLTVSPAGGYVLSDLTGSVALDMAHARIVPEDGLWLTPGMVVVVDGIYEEEGGAAAASALGGGSGVGGTIGGKVVALSIGGPPCERRDVTLGISSSASERTANAGGGFGWVDFLGVGSERSTGQRMREREAAIFAGLPAAAESAKVVVLGELCADNPRSLAALKKVLSLYDAEHEADTPMAFVLAGNFFSRAVMAGADGAGSVEFKETLDGLASALSEYPTLLQRARFVFAPGDNDPWASATSAGAAALIPRAAVPDMFTSRIRRAFAAADGGKPVPDLDARQIWTTNPARLSLFGTVHEILVFRDNISGRLRRNAVRLQPQPPSAAGAGASQADAMDVDGGPAEASAAGPDEDTRTARKVVKTLLDQGHLSPFPLSKRPVLWDYGSALQLYPLPTAMMLIDPEAPPFALTYEGCHVMNPGCLVADARRGLAKWVEYSPKTRRGRVRETLF